MNENKRMGGFVVALEEGKGAGSEEIEPVAPENYNGRKSEDPRKPEENKSRQRRIGGIREAQDRDQGNSQR